ncbi:MAG: hypothetical protein COA97_08180 [Flavobacteriales bacterium]|nr:MAG: hypothetical protein COA97_08180 [Flavobacteriales bacterium]
MKILTLFLLPLLFSCSLFEEEIADGIIARVEDKYLLQSDIVGIVPPNTPNEDSTLIIDNYIHGWIKDNLILQKAELNLKENQKDVSKQLEDYRKSLIIYSYEKELIKQRLDTVVSAEEIEAFYKENNQNFELKDDIVKVRYLKVNRKAPQLYSIRKLYKSNKEGDSEKLKELAHQYAEKFHLNGSQWILFEELKNEVPINVSQSKGYLKNIKNIELEDSLFFYFVHISDYRFKNDVSPLSFETHNIKNIIINKRKLGLINRIRDELYQEAFMSKDIEIYEVKNDEK